MALLPPYADLRVDRGSLWGRAWPWGRWVRIAPESIEDAFVRPGFGWSVTSWAACPAYLIVQTKAREYGVPIHRREFDQIVAWLSEHTRFRLEETASYHVADAKYRRDLLRTVRYAAARLAEFAGGAWRSAARAPVPGDGRRPAPFVPGLWAALWLGLGVGGVWAAALRLDDGTLKPPVVVGVLGALGSGIALYLLGALLRGGWRNAWWAASAAASFGCGVLLGGELLVFLSAEAAPRPFGPPDLVERLLGAVWLGSLGVAILAIGLAAIPPASGRQARHRRPGA